jgi:cytochrome c2
MGSPRPRLIKGRKNLWLVLAIVGISWLNPIIPAPKPLECVLAADAQRGKQWAPTCKACHDTDVHQPVHTQGGPNLHDVYLSVAGTQSLKYEYRYHPPLVAARNAGLIWTDENLDHYLEGPESFLNQTTGKSVGKALYMNFFIGGQDDAQFRARQD